eukprot:scaffold54597_cov18-Prasinocladus_malaysianus.AAC.1
MGDCLVAKASSDFFPRILNKLTLISDYNPWLVLFEARCHTTGRKKSPVNVPHCQRHANVPRYIVSDAILPRGGRVLSSGLAIPKITIGVSSQLEHYVY